MNRSRKRSFTGSLLVRWWQGLLATWNPRHALPCVGLIVVGGCLTFIMTPEGPISPTNELGGPASALPTIIIDPGHGGKDDGTKWRGLSEKDLTLELAGRVEKGLQKQGFRTLMTRRDNKFVALSERVRIANRTADAIFLSIHFNSENSGTSAGIETFYARRKTPPATEYSWVGLFAPGENAVTDTSEMLAGKMQEALTGRTAARSRGIHPCNFYVVQHTRHPAILIEAGFISNVFESGLLLTDVYRQSLAEAIVDGVVAYQKERLQPTRQAPTQLALRN